MQKLVDSIKRMVADMINAVAQPRYALVTSVSPDGHSIRATIQPEGTLTGWMPVPSLGVGGLSVVIPPAINDQVILGFAHGDHEHPFVQGRVYSDADPVPTSPADNKPLKNGECLIHGNGCYFLMQGGKLTIQSAAEIVLDAPKVTVTGDETLTGTASGSTGKLVTKGDIADQNSDHGTVAVLRNDYNGHHHGDSPTTDSPTP